MIISPSSLSTILDATNKNPPPSSSNASKLFVEQAAEQKNINYHLCLFHYQLIRILYLIVKYNMKSVKPLSFFDTKVSRFTLVWFTLYCLKSCLNQKGRHTLFSELHTHPLMSNDVDIKILNARKLVNGFFFCFYF